MQVKLGRGICWNSPHYNSNWAWATATTQARPGASTGTPPTAIESGPATQPRPPSKARAKLPIRKKAGQSVAGPSPTATEGGPAAQPRPPSKARAKLPIRKKAGQSVVGPSPTATEGGPSQSTVKGWSLANLLLGLPPLQLKVDHHS